MLSPRSSVAVASSLVIYIVAKTYYLLYFISKCNHERIGSALCFFCRDLWAVTTLLASCFTFFFEGFLEASEEGNGLSPELAIEEMRDLFLWIFFFLNAFGDGKFLTPSVRHDGPGRHCGSWSLEQSRVSLVNCRSHEVSSPTPRPVTDNDWAWLCDCEGETKIPDVVSGMFFFWSLLLIVGMTNFLIEGPREILA